MNQKKTKNQKKLNKREIQYQRALRLFKRLMGAFAVPEPMTVSQWADKYRVISPEAAAEVGRWRTDRAPYQREIMDAVSDPHVEMVVIMSSAQVGKTEVILNTIGWFIDREPCPILYVLPSKEMAEDYSKERLSPMIRDCPTLREKVSDLKARDGGNTIYQKRFPGGYVSLVGANSPAQLRGRPVRALFLDEVDGYPQSSGKEGDPVELARKRTKNFWNRKIILVSTPTNEDESKIEKEYRTSSMEELEVQCPNCGEWQPYVWGNLKFDHESGTDTAEILGYECRKCACLDSEVRWKHQPIRWKALHPEITKIRGFHLNEFCSPWGSWQEIADSFLKAKHKGVDSLKAWTNTTLGETFKQKRELSADEIIKNRRIAYNCQVPEEVLVLTAAVDVQDNRLEYEIDGWGKDYRSWGIKYGAIMSDPGQPITWSMLDDILFDTYMRADGQRMQIMTTCIDSGGHFTQQVYAYCKDPRREARRIWAIKGFYGEGVPLVRRPKSRNKAGAFLFDIGVDTGKDTLLSRLSVKYEKDPGYCFFPIEADRGFDDDYFRGLCSEHRVPYTERGQTRTRWEKITSGARNEPWDLRNYNSAAIEILNPNLEMLEKRRLNRDQQKTTTPQPKKRKGSAGIEL